MSVSAVTRKSRLTIAHITHQYKADYVAFYRSSLLFLACIDVDKDLSPSERLTRAHDLSIAALLGETIYNFGELLQHPILAALDGTDLEWIKQMLFVFNAGDIGKYESLVLRLPSLVSGEDDLGRVISLSNQSHRHTSPSSRTTRTFFVRKSV